MLRTLQRIKFQPVTVQCLNLRQKSSTLPTPETDSEDVTDYCALQKRVYQLQQYEYPANFDHPTAHLTAIETTIVSKLVDMKYNDHSAGINLDFVKGLYEDAMKSHETDELTRQMIADTMTSLIVKLDDSLVKEKLAPLIPSAAQQLGVDSTLLLCMSLGAFRQEEPLSEEADNVVTSILDTLRSRADFEKYKDSVIITQLILKAALVSSRWLEAVTGYWSHAHSESAVNPSAVRAALRNNAHDVALQLITPPKGADYLLFSERHILSPRMTSYSDSVSELVKSLPLQKLPDLLEILSKVECAVDSNAADILADRWDQFLKENKRGSEKSKITRLGYKGECLNCKSSLKTESISAKEISHLKDVFYNKSILDAGVYHLTHPVDLSKFLKYIDDSEPFDLVIDGMNLFFVPVKMRRVAEHKKAGAVKQIRDLIGKGRNKRILIIIREHAAKIIPREVRSISEVYAVKDDSADDVYALYAALKSGPKCRLISSDMFKQHNKYIRLQPGPEKLTFAKWQRLYTIPRFEDYIPTFPPEGSGGRYCPSLHTVIKTHVSGGRWHVPVACDILYNHTPRMPYIQEWMCLPVI